MAPSANRSRTRLGRRNATLNASIWWLAPKACASTCSRTSPRIRLAIVALPTSPAARVREGPGGDVTPSSSHGWSLTRLPLGGLQVLGAESSSGRRRRDGVGRRAAGGPAQAAGRQAAPAPPRQPPGSAEARPFGRRATPPWRPRASATRRPSTRSWSGLTPTDAVAHMQLGMSRAMGGRTAEAIAPLREALRLRPDLLPGQAVPRASRISSSGAPRTPWRRTSTGRARSTRTTPTHGRRSPRPCCRSTSTPRPACSSGALRGAARVAAGLGGAGPQLRRGLARGVRQAAGGLDPDSPYVWLLAADVLTVEEKYPAAFSLIKKAQAALPTLPGRAPRTGARVRARAATPTGRRSNRRRPTTSGRRARPCPVACAYLAGKFEDVVARTATAAQPAALYWRAQGRQRPRRRGVRARWRSCRRQWSGTSCAPASRATRTSRSKPRRNCAKRSKLAPGRSRARTRARRRALRRARLRGRAAVAREAAWHGARGARHPRRARRDPAPGPAGRSRRGTARQGRRRRPVAASRRTRRSAARWYRPASRRRAVPHLEKALAARPGRQRALPAGAGHAAHRSSRSARRSCWPSTRSVRRPPRPGVDDAGRGRRHHASGSVISTTRSTPGACDHLRAARRPRAPRSRRGAPTRRGRRARPAAPTTRSRRRTDRASACR